MSLSLTSPAVGTSRGPAAGIITRAPFIPGGGGGGNGGGGYSTGAKAGNGATYFSHGGAPSGLSDSPLWTFSVWLRPETDSNDLCLMQMDGTGASLRQPYIRFDEGFGLWRIQLQSDLSITSCPAALGSSPGFDGSWNHILMWINGTAQSQGGYLNGVSDVSADAVASGAIDFTGTDMFWLATAAAGDIIDGLCISDLWMDVGQIIDDPADFRDAGTGKPIDLGADGSTPGAGTQPAFFFKGGDFTTNLGYAGNPSRTGAALSDCASSPTD